jgi:calcineurin-like phosphoesterase family protein
MSNTFLISDTHFGHLGVCKFLRDDGTKLRPWESPEEMDEYMVNAWNQVVGKHDKVYHLGDVVINRKALSTLSRLNGDLVLIKGNHDIFRLGEYATYFRDIRGYHVLDNMLLSHIPVHPDSKGRFKANIHGHLHYQIVKKPDGTVDPWYFNVSVERINFEPIPLEIIKDYVSRQDYP